ncbi:MAG TPA: hypothetical protein VKT49_08930 [Bryobacteraceae bacterium]|nr:hypothetical protein [Bryobacteraceae bacterium]
MSIVIAVSIVVCVAVAAGLVLAVRRLACPRVALPATLDWIDELSTDRYQPMLRLLDEDELRFLSRQPGFTPKLAAQFRRQRCEVFRGYLRSLSRDFTRVSIALKLLMVQASSDRPDLAAALIRTRVAFTFALVAVHLHVILYSLGLGSVNASNLLRLFDGIRLELRTLVPCDASSAA